MSDHPVLVLMRNDIDRVRSEFPMLDADVIDRIYEQLVVALLRQPTDDEFRARIAELTTRMDGPTLRGFLGLPPKARAAGGSRTTAMPATAQTADDRRRRSGRPKGTRSATRDQIVEAFQTFRATHHRRPTQAQLAANLKPPIAVRTLQALLAEYGLPWPVE